MSQQIKTVLNGKVTIQTLPVYHEPSTELELKRLLLNKGELAQFYDSPQPIHFIGYVEFPENTIRGGHYHPWREEHFYLIQGTMLLALQDLATNELIMLEIKTGDVVLIPPNIAHGIKAITSGHGIEFSSYQFNPEGTIAYPALISALQKR